MASNLTPEQLINDQASEIAAKEARIQQLEAQLANNPQPRRTHDMSDSDDNSDDPIDHSTIHKLKSSQATSDAQQTAQASSSAADDAYYGYPPMPYMPMYNMMYPVYPGMMPFSPTPDPSYDPSLAPPDQPSPPQDKFTEELTKQLEGLGPKEDHDVTTDPIPEPCAATLEKWFHKQHSKKEIIEALQTCKRPENCSSLKVVTINDEIKKSMSRKNHDKDKKMRYLCTALAKAGQPLATAWAKILRLNHDVKNAPMNIDLGTFLENTGIDLPSIVSQMELGLQLLGICHVQAVQKRRSDLQYLLTASAKELGNENQPITTLMFGDKIKEHHKEIMEVDRITRSTTSTPRKGAPSAARFNPYTSPRPFLGHHSPPYRGRGRGMGRPDGHGHRWRPQFHHRPHHNDNPSNARHRNTEPNNQKNNYTNTIVKRK